MSSIVSRRPPRSGSTSQSKDLRWISMRLGTSRTLSRRAKLRRVLGASTRGKRATPRRVESGQGGGGCACGKARPSKIAQRQDTLAGRSGTLCGAVDAHGPRPTVTAYVARRRSRKRRGRLRLLVDGGRVAPARRFCHPHRRATIVGPVPDSPSASSTGRRDRDLLRTLAAGTAGVVGDAFLRALVRHLAEAFAAELAFVAEFEDDAQRVVVLAARQHGVELAEGSELAVAGAAAELAAGQELVWVPEGACERFPDDPLVQRHRLDACLAAGLPAADGSAPGHIAGHATRRIEAGEDDCAALAIFARRAAAEIERNRQDAARRGREAEVEASRARIVAASDEERRRIGRDLHDGAQQRLVALGHLLALAERRLREDGAADSGLIAQAREQAAMANEELRELARGLHPAGLTEYGLGHALAALATRSPLSLQIGELPDRRLPEAVEVALFYLVSEALSNALKHAQATEVRADVRLRGGRVVAEVVDDGAGGASAEGGSGLAGLTDRLAALDGTLRVHSPAGGGTQLEATIPLEPYRREPVLEFGFEGDDGLGERLIGLILDRRKTATVALAREWELEGGAPRIGQRLPVLDARGHRRATVEVTQVMVVPFAVIDDDVVAAELAGVSSAEDWRATQREFYETRREETAVL